MNGFTIENDRTGVTIALNGSIIASGVSPEEVRDFRDSLIMFTGGQDETNLTGTQYRFVTPWETVEV